MAIKLKPPRWTIGAKLVTLIALLLLSSAAGVGLISTNIMVSNDSGLIAASNLNAAALLASQVRETFASATEKLRILGSALVQSGIPPQIKDRIVSEFFAGDHDFLAVYVHSSEASGAPKLQTGSASPELAKLGDPDGMKTLKTISDDKNFQFGQLARGEAQIAAIRLPDSSN